MRRPTSTRCWLAALALVSSTAWAGGPVPGRYDATLCVATVASAPPSCGAIEFDMISASMARLRVADIVYQLALRTDQLDVVTMHGAMQIDEFTAPYAWQGEELAFIDADKGVRYTVRVGKRRR